MPKIAPYYFLKEKKNINEVINMKKAILFMALGGALTFATLVAIENKVDMNRTLKKMNKGTMRAYRFIKDKVGS